MHPSNKLKQVDLEPLQQQVDKTLWEVSEL